VTGRRGWLIDAGVIATTLGLAYLLKRFYSQASFDDLLWVLTPTTWLVELLSGSSFELEAHRAYLSRDLLFEIVPSCAGLNFLIVTFCSLSCGLLPTRRTTRGKLGHVLVSGVVAYVATLLANATRIWIGIQLHVRGLSLAPLTPDRLHRIEGIAVYFLFLLATLKGTDRFLRKGDSSILAIGAIAVPLFWYLGWTVGVPLANGAADRTGFWEHALTTLVVTGVLSGSLAWTSTFRTALATPHLPNNANFWSRRAGSNR
jgi:exosortase K